MEPVGGARVSCHVMPLRPLLLAGTALVAAALPGFAAAKKPSIFDEDHACRSVHLAYRSDAGTAFYNEARVIESAPGSYFMVAGFNGGYFGIQELANGKKVVIFSLWDSEATNDPKAVPESRRTKAVYNDPEVRIGRFGGEGTGGQSFFDYDWKNGQVCRFLVQVRPADEGRAEYTGFFYIPETKTWKRLATFSSPSAPKQLGGLYSFVEDFRRNGESTKHTRRSQFGPAFVLGLDGAWKPVATAKFTATTDNASPAIDAGLADKRFFLATGGAIANTTVKLWENITNPDAPAAVPADAADAIAKFAAAAPKATATQPAK